MVVSDPQIERIAEEVIAKHGARAALVATERLNRMIDRNDTLGRDIWACVVRVIHERQGTGPAAATTAGGSSGKRRWGE